MTAAAETPAATRMPIAILALAAVNFAVGTQGFVFGGVLAELAHDLGVTIGRAGLLLAASAIVFAISAPIAAIVAARMDRKVVILVALGALALVNIASGLAPDFWTLFGLRVLAGAATGFSGALVGAAVAPLVAPERRGKAFALVIGGMTVAFVVGIPIGSVVGGEFGWRATFEFGAAVTVLAMVLIAALLPRQPAGAAAPAMRLDAVLANGEVVRLLVLGLLGFMAMFTVVAFVGPLVTHATGLTGRGVGFYQLFVGLGSFVGLAAGGALSDRGLMRPGLLGLFVVMAGSLLGYGAVLAAPATATPGWLLAPLILVGAASLFALMPLALSRLSVAAGAMAPLALSLNGSMTSLGQGAGSFWGGMVTDLAGFAWTGVAGATLAVVALAVAFSLRAGDTSSRAAV